MLLACFSKRFSLVLVRTFRLGRNTLNECKVEQNLFEGPRFSLVLARTFRLGRNTLNECRVGQNFFEGPCDVQFRTCLYQTGAKLTSRGLGGPGPPLRILAGSPGGCQGLVQSRAFTFPD